MSETGGEYELFQQLTSEYGPEPPDLSGPAEATALPSLQAPAAPSTPPPPQQQAPAAGSIDAQLKPGTRARLIRFYEAWAPEKIVGIDVILFGASRGGLSISGGQHDLLMKGL